MFVTTCRSYSVQITKPSSVIKLPVYVKRHNELFKKKDAKKQIELFKKITYRGNTKVPVISSNVKQHNFYLGQLYNPKFPIPLISKYWFKAKSSGQKFMICPWERNPSLPVKLSPTNTDLQNSSYLSEFSEFSLNERLLQNLSECEIKCPTPVQSLLIQGISSHHHVVCTAETGCGKTLGYLLPVLTNILEYKKHNKSLPETPLALILTPGRELAEQIAKVAQDISRDSGINVKLLVSKGTEVSNLIPYAKAEVDILVACFGAMSELSWKKGVFKLGNLQHLIFDEADTLIDDSFIERVSSFLQYITVQLETPKNNIKPYGAQLIFISSTYPRNIDDVLPESFAENDVVRIFSPYAHKIQPHVPQKFLRVTNDARAGELLSLVKHDCERNVPVMIFCNKSVACDWLSSFLTDNGIKHACFHSNIDLAKRGKKFEAFQNGEVNVLCCTDLASRGLDTQRVRHVINFDFPHNTSDYILRAGRVGRVGTNHGRVTSLIVSVPGIYALQEIEMAVRKVIPIENVDANIKKKINRLYFSH